DLTTSQVPEWTNLFLGNGTTNGRYGTQGWPGSPTTAVAPGGSGIPHFYGHVDYDGCDETTVFGPSGPIALPGDSTYSVTPLTSFAGYTKGYGDGSPNPPATWSFTMPPPYPRLEKPFHPL